MLYIQFLLVKTTTIPTSYTPIFPYFFRVVQIPRYKGAKIGKNSKAK
jgi:hypothetical protein